MAVRADKIKIGAFLWPTGHHVAAWRHPEAQTDAGVNFEHFVALARTAERGLLDLIFLADQAAVFLDEPDRLSYNSYIVRFEPVTLISALIPFTTHLGFISTSTTTYDEPYHVARRFASLDQISGGRTGWNLVTSYNPAEALNFGRDEHLEHDARYRRGREFAEVVKGLWDSWGDDAFVRDKQSGLFLDPAKMHVLNHKGEHFKVRGPLNVARSPQGQPVIVQAGSSEVGRDLASEVAEIVFTAHQSVSDAKAFYQDIKTRAENFGRDPSQVKIMPGVSIVVAPTEQEARDKFERLQELIHPKVGLMQLSQFIGYDLSSFPVDGPLPSLPDKVMVSSRPALLAKMAREENLTIRQLYTRIAGTRGHWQIVGTPAQVADKLQEWFESEAADGFNFMPPLLPGSLDDLVTFVVPELQRRGLYRQAYEGRTLRENLGLRIPPRRAHRPAQQSSKTSSSLSSKPV
jgi:FMN-dependent oxidoreductase (nitrilotriacetate monooxygenase family)